MSVIHEADFIESIAEALQFISCYHSSDFINALVRAYQRERSPQARDAMAQILLNSRMCAEGRRPICQDTGIVNVFLKVGIDVQWQTKRAISELVNDGVRRAYTDSNNPLRASVVDDPEFSRRNTGDNTPAITHIDLVPGAEVEVTIGAKGGGSENKARFTVLLPSEPVGDWIIETVSSLGAGWCPPGILGIGIGGTAEKAMLLAKESLFDEIDIDEIFARGTQSKVEELRIDLYERINKLGIGAQGLGGVTTVLDVKVRTYPTHAAAKPVALIPNCAASRHIRFKLDGSGRALFTPPSGNLWPELPQSRLTASRPIDIDRLTREDVANWKAGDVLLLSGRLLTARDAAHQRIASLLQTGQQLPPGLNLRDRIVYYVGPVSPAKGEVVGPSGPTTANRMDRFTEVMLGQAGVLAMIGKAERGRETIASIQAHASAYLIAVGGAAYLISKAIRSARLVAFADLGMEAVYEFEVANMPVTVAVDSTGASLHQIGPAFWKGQLASEGPRIAVEAPK